MNNQPQSKNPLLTTLGWIIFLTASLLAGLFFWYSPQLLYEPQTRLEEPANKIIVFVDDLDYWQTIKKDSQIFSTQTNDIYRLRALRADQSSFARQSIIITTSPPADVAAELQAEIIELDNCQNYLFPAVSLQNNLQNISLEDLKAVLKGEINTWQELGWNNNQPIDLYLPFDYPNRKLVYQTMTHNLISQDDLTHYQPLEDLYLVPAETNNYLALVSQEQLLQAQGKLRHLTIDNHSPLKKQGNPNDYLLQKKLNLIVPHPESLKQGDLESVLQELQAIGYSNQNDCFSDLITIIGVGDIMLSRHVGTMIRQAGDNSLPFRKTAEFLASADLTFGNLESPFNNTGAIITEGMRFKAEPETIEGLLLSGFDMLSLANNHFGDQGRAGMAYTFDYLNQHEIKYFGAGHDRQEAYSPKGRLVKNKQICFLGYNEISPDVYQASDTQAGHAWMHEPDVRASIEQTKKGCDYLIASFHWGIEYTPYPTTNQKKFARLAIDSGADMVISHHPHVVQAVEFYQGKFIAYSLGNFVFDQMWSTETQQGLIAKLVLSPIEDYDCHKNYPVETNCDSSLQD
ncbi:MAG TPA: hypothetical protein ENN77_00435, partial [Candidatus Wirthbacteria bacterium]|nr:hypothetical protein [Candidatus Wirthbacteria bacterium]